MRGGLQRLLWFALLLKLNSSVFFFFSHEQFFTLQHRISRNLRSFALARLFFLYTDEGDLALSLVLKP